MAIEYKKIGFDVKGFDVDQSKIDLLNSGKSYIKHIKSDEIKTLLKDGVFATSDFAELSDVDVIFVCVPTPIDKYRNPFMGHIEDTSYSVSKNLKRAI